MQADTLISADYLYTGQTRSQADQSELFSPGAIALKGGQVVAVGTPDELVSTITASHSEHFPGHILMPGLINSHAHSAMTLFRGLADDLPLMVWLNEHIWPAEGKWVSEEFVRAGTRLAMAEMLLSGTTCFTDMYFFPEVVASEAERAGMRTFLACPIMDFPTNWGSGPDEYIEKTLALLKSYQSPGKSQGLVTVGFGPHAPYSVSDAPLKNIAELAQTFNTFVHMHVHETQHEVDEALKNTGQRPLARLEQLGLLGPHFQAVHFTAASEADIAMVARNNVTVVHCPASNLKLASGFSPVAQLLDADVNLTLGTDGAASNNALDMFSELRLASLLAKATANSASACPAPTTLTLATANAGLALAKEQKLGQLCPGSPADFIAVKLDDAPNVQPLYNPVSQLAYALNSSQVNHVWINGQNVVKERQLLSLDLESILEETRQWQDKLSRKD